MRTIDEVYAWEQTRSQGLLIDVEHATLGRLRLAGPPLRFFDPAGQEVTRTAHTAPPTLDQDGAAVRAWLARGLRLTSRPRPDVCTADREEGGCRAAVRASTATGGWSSRPTSARTWTSRSSTSLDQLDEVIRRDFEAKAPSGTEILRRIEAGDHYRNRFELCATWR